MNILLLFFKQYMTKYSDFNIKTSRKHDEKKDKTGKAEPIARFLKKEEIFSKILTANRHH